MVLGAFQHLRAPWQGEFPEEDVFVCQQLLWQR